MEIDVKISWIFIFFSFSRFQLRFYHIGFTLMLPMSQLQTQQLMTSQSRSHTEYLIQTYNVHVLFLYLKLMINVAAPAFF